MWIFGEMIKSVKQKSNSQHIIVLKRCIRQRLELEKITIVANSYPGHSSPLADIEQDVVLVLIQVAQLCKCVTPSRAIYLINVIIKVTNTLRK